MKPRDNRTRSVQVPFMVTDEVHMTPALWEPLPSDIAEWMGLDETMVPTVLSWSEPASA